MNRSAAFEALSASVNTPTVLPGFEVNTYDCGGTPLFLIGRFDSIAAARDGISDPACVDLEGLGDNNYAGSVLPSIVESWFIGPVEYIIHSAA